MKVKYSLAAFIALTTLNAEEVNLGSVSVTATKVETATKEVSQSIAVVDEETIEDRNILNIQEAIENIPGVNADSSTNSPSPRLIIRGAGLKARYGVREIMVMKDGVPMTDPDSFTRFDFIDMQDVESIEVQKGPGSINAVNTVGGVIQLRTKSVFKDDKNRIRLGIGNDGQTNVNLKAGKKIDENNFISTTISRRTIDNSWRDHNDFDSTQFSQKYGHIFKDDSTIEMELSYTESNMNIPARMTEAEYETFKATGEQKDTSSQWQHSARDSKILAYNVKYEKEYGNLTWKPHFYFNTWSHFHPVTAMINDSGDNSVYGIDLETNYKHKFFGNKAMLVTGITAKADITKDSKKYEYADFVDGGGGVIVKTLSNRKGALAETSDSETILYGAYLAETFSPSKKLKLDFSTRVDRISFDVSGNEIRKFNWFGPSVNTYSAGAGLYGVSNSYNLLSVKFGGTYKLTKTTNAYASVAQADQAPTGSEMEDNINLKHATSANYEIGLKTRTKTLSSDIAIYQNDVTDEIIQTVENAVSGYYNAGETQKRGLEINTVYQVSKPLKVGVSYAYSDYKYVKFEEKVGASYVSRDGNYLNYIPKNQYSLFAAVKAANGFKARVTTKTWGSYYMDNANTEKYEGYDFVTELMLGFDTKDKKHSLQLNIRNLTNEHYAMQADKDVNGVKTYRAAAPMSGMLTYKYQF